MGIGSSIHSWWRRRRTSLPANASISSSDSPSTMNEPPVARGETMFGIPIETLVTWANVISLSSLAITVVGTIVAFQLSARMNAANIRELHQVQSEASAQIETSRAATARASARTAQLVRVAAELQLELQSEKQARTALSAQLQTRDMTKEQMAKFVESIKGKIRQLSLFIVPDREASIFGITVLDALRRAGVFVTWQRMQSPAHLSPDVADTGVIIYECPGGGGDECAGRTLLKAFSAIDVQSRLLNSAQPLQGFPSPSLVIALKPPGFLRAADEPIPSDVKATGSSDLPRHAD
jgi:hypothetical protein